MSPAPDRESLARVLKQRARDFEDLPRQLLFKGVSSCEVVWDSDPIIVTGTISVGNWITKYVKLHAFGDTCKLFIGTELGTVREDCWVGISRDWVFPEAGWLSPSEVEDVMIKLLGDYYYLLDR